MHKRYGERLLRFACAIRSRRNQQAQPRVARAPDHTRATFEWLEARYVLAAPTLAPIGDVTLMAGAPLHIALNGFDADGDALSFSAVSTQPAVTAAIPTGNRSLKIDVAGFGAMKFQLFEDLVPRVTSHIISLANSGFYNGVTFHRVMRDYLIQGGDPTGTGTGGSPLGPIDDQFNLALQHTGTGVLAMADAADDTSDSQFYIAEDAQRQWDFQHSIFGFLTEGEAVREAISNVDINWSDYTPLSPVTMTAVSVFTDTSNGVLRLSAPPGTFGPTSITVTVSDGHGGQAVQSFTVNVFDDVVNNDPFLDDISPVVMTQNSQATFQLHSKDAEGDQVHYFDADQLHFYFGMNSPIAANSSLPYFVGFNSGQVIVVPPNGTVGEFKILLGVGDKTGFYASADSQVVDVFVLPLAPTISLDAVSDSGISQVDRITNRDNSPSKGLNFLISGLKVGAGVQLLADGNVIGQVTANAVAMRIPTNETSTLSNGPHTIHVRQTIDGVSSLLPAELQFTVDTIAPVFVTTPPAQAVVGRVFHYEAKSNGEGVDGHVYSLPRAPNGMSVDSVSGLISWKPTIGQIGASTVVLRSTDGAGNIVEQSFVIDVTASTPATVVGRDVFYNNSKFDVGSIGLGPTDDAAIASDKTALLPGGTATKANYTSYSRGVNGIIIDISGLTTILTASDFAFRIGNDNNPNTWVAAPDPVSISVRFGAGVAGSTRVELAWADGAIKNCWLQITVKPNQNTGLTADDRFYFGNAVGESGNSATEAAVNAIDEINARMHSRTFANPAGIEFPYDFNRDGFVNATDQILARGNSTTLLTSLKLIHPPKTPVTLDPIADVTLLAGAPLQIPLTGFGDDLGALSFTIASTNPAISGTTNQANRSLKLAVTHTGATPADVFSGEMVFELYEDRAPITTARIIELAQAGFYNGLTFHRAINDFVIQGGDPTGTGTSGSGISFDDEYSPDLQYTSTGILGMAKSQDDTNDSQFFITELPQRHLDFNYSIFGRLTAGESIREAISNVPTNANNKPLADVTVTSATVFFDSQRRVLLLQAPIGATGSDDVSVTITNGYGQQAQRTFHVTLAPDTNNNRPILGSTSPILVPYNGVASFQLTSFDVEGDPVFYDKASPDFNLSLTLDNDNGAGTIQAQNNFAGVASIFVGVRPVFLNGNDFDPYDVQEIPVLVAPPIPQNLDLLAASDTGVSDSDNITSRNNQDAAHKLQFNLTGVLSGAEVTLYDGNTLIGAAIASGGTVTVTTTGTFELTVGQHSITARQTLQNQSLENIGNEHGTIDIPSAHSSPLIVTIVAEPLLAPAAPLADALRASGSLNSLDVSTPINKAAMAAMFALFDSAAEANRHPDTSVTRPNVLVPGARGVDFDDYWAQPAIRARTSRPDQQLSDVALSARPPDSMSWPVVDLALGEIANPHELWDLLAENTVFRTHRSQ